jgi:hypothetical protein
VKGTQAIQLLRAPWKIDARSRRDIPMKGHIKLFTLQLDLELAAKLDASRRARVCADEASKLSVESVLPLMD